jgi:hypothetical protein
VAEAYGAKLAGAGLPVERHMVSADGQDAQELRVGVAPGAVARVVQVGNQTVVTVTLASA